MSAKQWQETALSVQSDPPVWELFHENSKNARFPSFLSDAEVRDHISKLHESLPFDGFPIVSLPKHLPTLRMPLGKAILSRVSVREMRSRCLTLRSLAALLHFSYGITRGTRASGFLRGFRVVPSAGALYPLEVFFHSAKVEGLRDGLYHYNPSKHHLRFLREGDHRQQIAQSVIQTSVAYNASLLIFITALFERSIFKYGDRGYRFVLLESGHVAQNINLVSSALGLASLDIGGFFDCEIDDFLQLDGITHSTIYMLAVGMKAQQCSSRTKKLKRGDTDDRLN